MSEALFWFSFSLPFAGHQPAAHAHVLLAPAPVDADAARARSLVVNAAVSLALYEPLGIGGIVLGTTVSNVVMTLLQARRLRRGAGRARGRRARCARRRSCSPPRRCSGGRLRRLVRARRRCSGARCPPSSSRSASALALGTAAYAAALLRQRPARGAPDPRPVRRAGSSRRRLVTWYGPPWPTRPTSATSRSSPTSTTGSRRWPTASSR